MFENLEKININVKFLLLKKINNYLLNILNYLPFGAQFLHLVSELQPNPVVQPLA